MVFALNNILDAEVLIELAEFFGLTIERNEFQLTIFRNGPDTLARHASLESVVGFGDHLWVLVVLTILPKPDIFLICH
jgi:hypothetical protein